MRLYALSYLRSIFTKNCNLKHNGQVLSGIMVKALAHNGVLVLGDRYNETKNQISISTNFVTSEMVPEFSLHVITPEMEIWKQPFEKLPEKMRDIFYANYDPYWAIFWPGGQVLCRYIID